MALRTSLTDSLGIELPIVQSGMRAIAGPDLVAAVSEAGGLGILAGAFTAPDELRQGIRAVLEGSGEDTVISDAISGLPGRALKNELVAGYATEARLPPLLQRRAAEDIHAAAARTNDRRFVPLFAGQSVGLIHDVPGAGDVVRAVAAEAEAALARLRG